ncbi:DCC1-like thiol-disulfide oxidoreductase family protein [Cognatishimia sp. 1_MG-2023]|uniref:thiol-disulfide oxidoreductase DCC family protein n=1 Tax=Cognatishimia sp. 1_MG-2023 TaxID=3062642 RepID=UPI0026E45AD7|nr:DCC1-like thiol-disulfide oxidoreductase family protein [Cognatishimia sp. 1_MG-2023]MDO6725704.1 DCC1-like thiol-disulfide oxidoreductase family protein [Cognatishimia sp. 1_MG-2023]
MGAIKPDVIVFDGHCILCQHFFQFVLRRDRAEHYAFAVAQSDFGQQLYAELGLPGDRLETMLVVDGGTAYQKLDGVCAIMARLGGIWSVLGWMRVLPRPLKNLIYGIIAKNRFRLFGRRETCMVPSADLRDRFVPGGWI